MTMKLSITLRNACPRSSSADRSSASVAVWSSASGMRSSITRSVIAIAITASLKKISRSTSRPPPAPSSSLRSSATALLRGTLPGSPYCLFFRSARISFTALWAGAPVTPPPGMGPRPDEVEPLDRHPVASPADERPPGEPGVEAGLLVVGVAAGQAVLGLEVDAA